MEILAFVWHYFVQESDETRVIKKKDQGVQMCSHVGTKCTHWWTLLWDARFNILLPMQNKGHNSAQEHASTMLKYLFLKTHMQLYLQWNIGQPLQKKKFTKSWTHKITLLTQTDRQLEGMCTLGLGDFVTCSVWRRQIVSFSVWNVLGGLYVCEHNATMPHPGCRSVRLDRRRGSAELFFLC